jgi:cyclase
VQLIHVPSAHSDADSIVLFRRADVLVAGDVFDLRHFPIIDTAKGGTINGELAALNRMIDLTIPAHPLIWHEDRTLIIPGHGRVCDQADLVEYRDMLTIIRDVIQDMIKRGMTLDQVKKANPTKGYRKEYGSDTGPWTTDMFVTAVYESLTAKP